MTKRPKSIQEIAAAHLHALRKVLDFYVRNGSEAQAREAKRLQCFVLPVRAHPLRHGAVTQLQAPRRARSTDADR